MGVADAAGLPFLANLTPPAGSKTVAELKEIVESLGIPFIVKGVMTVVLLPETQLRSLKAKKSKTDKQ